MMSLEDRRLLAPLVVMNTNSSGPGSLAQEIALANANHEANTITFEPAVFGTITPQAIELSGSQLVLSDTHGTQEIIGPAHGVIIDAGGGRVVCSR